MENKKRKIIAGSLGSCVHVAGMMKFLELAEGLGYDTDFLGTAVPVDKFINQIKKLKPDIVGMSYRLTPGVAEKLFRDFKDKAGNEFLKNHRFVFGGTLPVCRVAERSGIFERCFTGMESMSEIIAFLEGRADSKESRERPDSLLGRLETAGGFPLLRHHIGLPSMEKTIGAIEKIAEAGVLDIISIAPDQNAQESFFRQEEMDPLQDGAGGVPIRSREDLIRLKEAGNRGNHPLFRIYGGTRDLVEWAKISKETINNAWGAVPLCWYSVLDGRSNRLMADAITENRQAMAWYAENGIPLEVNESHQWSLRDTHDTMAVVMAYLAAYNAKALGVKHYVSQYMFNTPPMISSSMDLAKMLAKIEMIESLHDENFISFRQVRAGLLHLSPKPDVAKGQLASSAAHSLQLNPHILHVVSYCEGDHAAGAEEVIESCGIVQGVINNCLEGSADSKCDPHVSARKDELLEEAGILLNGLVKLAKCMNRNEKADHFTDPFTDPFVLAEAIRLGILDAPHLKGNPYAAGVLETRSVNGAIKAWDSREGRPLSEKERLDRIWENGWNSRNL